MELKKKLMEIGGKINPFSSKKSLEEILNNVPFEEGEGTQSYKTIHHYFKKNLSIDKEGYYISKGCNLYNINFKTFFESLQNNDKFKLSEEHSHYSNFLLASFNFFSHGYLFNENNLTNEKYLYVLLETYHFFSLDLSDLGFKTIPSELIKIQKLKGLSFENNDLTELPPEIGKLKNLTSLNLSKNKLERLPNELGELNLLERLYLDNNDLTKLPQRIEELNNLWCLDLSNNGLTELPSVIKKLSGLQQLYLEGNNFKKLPEIKKTIKVDY